MTDDYVTPSEVVSQSEFARMKGVTRKTVGEWKHQDLLVMVGTCVNVSATQARLLENSRHRAKGRRAPITLRCNGDTQRAKVTVVGDTLAVTTPRGGTVSALTDELPPTAEDWAIAIGSGSTDLVVLLLRHGVAEADVRGIVAAWVDLQRQGACECLEDSSGPPAGCASWSEVRAFAKPWADDLGAPWTELEAEAASMPR